MNTPAVWTVSGLRQRQDLEHLIERAESSRENDQRLARYANQNFRMKK